MPNYLIVVYVNFSYKKIEVICCPIVMHTKMSQPLKRKYIRRVADVADLESDMKRLTVDWKPDFEIPLTFGQEIQWNIYEYYTNNGIPVPVEEREIGKAIDFEREEENKKYLSEELYKRFYGTDHPAPPVPPTVSSGAGEKPEFGTPAFWAWARRRKIEKMKEAEVKATEKEAAKKAKEDAKAAAIAEKAALKVAKAAKATTKEK
jgi:hypothetical protein